MKRGLLFFILFAIFGFLISRIVKSEKDVPVPPQENQYVTKKIKPRKPVRIEEEHDFNLNSKAELEENVFEGLEENEARDPFEWQGMRVPKMQPPCDVKIKDSCGMAMACLDGVCGPCKDDRQCGDGERCVLQHCVRDEKTNCTERNDCDEEALCVLSGYSSGIRGNVDMVAFCQDSSELEEQIEDPEERRIFDEIRGPYESSGLEFSDLSKGLRYD